jgi:hypothetical protein
MCQSFKVPCDSWPWLIRENNLARRPTRLACDATGGVADVSAFYRSAETVQIPVTVRNDTGKEDTFSLSLRRKGQTIETDATHPGHS